MTQAYVYRIQPVRPDLIQTMTQAEETLLDEHFVYLNSSLKQGQLLIAGPCEDAAFGIVVFCAKSDDAAQAIMDNDPAVRGKVMDAGLHRFRVSSSQERGIRPRPEPRNCSPHKIAYKRRSSHCE